ncbi:TetR/AcrR family transcriptional regulator [Micromonospora sp. NPDC049275]|uniref:TetR/AcrR family transcriptional regulator n=1 Tax=unclassified Micromonospora TaxID=2617518 RepID=UPI00342022C6
MLRGEITTAIRRALMQELAAVGYGRLSIEAVARRAGVSKTAIYRRWSSKPQLVLEIVSAAAGQRLPLPDTGDLRGDLEILFMIMARALRHPLAAQIIPDLLAEAARNPQMAQTLEQVLRTNQRDIAGQLVGRAIERGQLGPDTDLDLAVDLIVGPLYWRLAVSRAPLSADDLPRLATMVATALEVACQPTVRSEPGFQPTPMTPGVDPIHP